MAARTTKKQATRKAADSKIKTAPPVEPVTPTNPTENAPNEKWTDAEVIAQIKSTAGNISLAALRLGMNRSWLSVRVNKSPELRQVCDDAREMIIDNAETALLKAVNKSEPWAVTLVLKTLGKKRGYIERKEITGEDGTPIQVMPVIVMPPAEEDEHGAT